MELIYLDHNATTPIHPEVKKSIIESLDIFGNASSLHPHGIQARELIENSRELLMKFLGADEGRIIFTSSGSESNNLVLKGLFCEGSSCALSQLRKLVRPHIITSSIEHPSVINTVECLKRAGTDVTFLPVDEFGMVDPEDLISAIKPSTVLVSIMMGNNEVGTVQPVKEIGRICHEREISFHCDAVQTVTKLPINVNELNIDFLSLSGHKINAPKGIGALYIRKEINICPLIHGGHQERNLRAGTENNLGIIALGKAIEIAFDRGENHNLETIALRDLLQQRLFEKLDGVLLNGHPTQRLPGTVNVSFDRIDGAAVLEMLAMLGISASSGSACSSGSGDVSHVLHAMGLKPERIRGAVRFSVGDGNTHEEIEHAADVIANTVTKIRALSPL